MTALRRSAVLVGLALAPTLLGGCASGMPSEMAAAPSPAMEERARQSSTAMERTLVWRSSLQLRALEPEEVAPSLHQRAEAVGGYVHQGRVTADRATVELRIPPEELERFLDSASELGSVQERSVSFEDVSTDVIDLDARLANLVAVRDRLQEHLARSANVSEIIEVERELARLQGEIDSLTGRLAFLRSSSSYAAVTIQVDRQRVLGPVGLVASGVGRALSWLVFIR